MGENKKREPSTECCTRPPAETVLSFAGWLQVGSGILGSVGGSKRSTLWLSEAPRGLEKPVEAGQGKLHAEKQIEVEGEKPTFQERFRS